MCFQILIVGYASIYKTFRQRGRNLVPYSQHYLSSQLTNGPNKVGLHYTGLERLAMDKQPNLIGQIVRYEEKSSVVNTAPESVN